MKNLTMLLVMCNDVLPRKADCMEALVRIEVLNNSFNAAVPTLKDL